MIHTATSANRKTERITLAVLIAFALLLTGCQTSPEKKKLNHYNKGVEYLQKGEAQSAVLELKNAIEIDGNFADAHYQLGLAYLNLREYDKATIAFGNAASNDPTNIDARLQIANYYYTQQQDYLKAQQELENILHDYPNNAEVYAALGSVYYSQEKRRKRLLPSGRAWNWSLVL